MKHLIITVITFFFVNANAATSFPRAAKLAYVDRCSVSLTSQGLSSQRAKAYCSCAINGMEDEFGMEEYDLMMKSEADPSGNEYDRRLYKVLVACGKYLPQ